MNVRGDKHAKELLAQAKMKAKQEKGLSPVAQQMIHISTRPPLTAQNLTETKKATKPSNQKL